MSAEIPENCAFGIVTAFPWRLHDLLEDAEKRGFDHIISWHPGGRGFKVHKPKEFVKTTLPLYFNQSRYKSFQRQLNMYGFHRIVTGKNKGFYFHELMIKGRSDLCRYMSRAKVKRRKKGSKPSYSYGDEESAEAKPENDQMSLIKISIPPKNNGNKDDFLQGTCCTEGIFGFVIGQAAEKASMLRKQHEVEETKNLDSTVRDATNLSWKTKQTDNIFSSEAIQEFTDCETADSWSSQEHRVHFYSSGNQPRWTRRPLPFSRPNYDTDERSVITNWLSLSDDDVDIAPIQIGDGSYAGFEPEVADWIIRIFGERAESLQE